METVGELDDEYADVVAGGNHETEKIISSLRKVGIKILHILADLAELSNAINKKSDGLAEFSFDVFES